MTDSVASAPLPEESDRARRLFLFLRDLSELRSKPVREIVDYESVVWFNDRPDAFGWSRFSEELDDDLDRETWLEMERVRLPKPPVVPETLEPWIRRDLLGRSDLEEPGLIEPEEPGVAIPDSVSHAYESYLRDRWVPWAEEHQRLKPAYDFYSSLFAMNERRQRLGEVYELVIGVGLLSWKRGGQRVQRHLVTSPVEISVDSSTGRVDIRPSGTEGRNRFELDMLDPHDRGPAGVVQDLVEEVEGLDPFSIVDEVERLLRSWVNRAHAEGSYDTRLSPPAVSSELQISLAPALILRKRGQRTLNELLEEIANQLGAGGELPEGVLRLISTDEPGESGLQGIGFDDPEVYFPLPSNEEQRQIVGRMAGQRGIVVQGPPGTGKSHTIANLISHLLAQGKRVLVTSHTERALKVLRDKLPDEIKPLCIALLGSDRQSIRELEGAVEEISSRQADWSDSESDQRVKRLRGDLQRIRERRAKAANELREMRESETHPISVGAYRGTAQQIASQLSRERETLGWIPDPVGESQPPLSSGEFTNYLELHWSLPANIHELRAANLPDSMALPAPSEIAELVERERYFSEQREKASHDYGEWTEHLERFETPSLETAIASLGEHADLLESINDSQPWVESARSDVLSGRDSVWRVLSEEVEGIRDSLGGSLEELGDSSIELGVDQPLLQCRRQVEELLTALDEGRTLRVGLFATGAARRNRDLLEQTTVDGARPLERASLERLRAYLDVVNLLDAMRESWGERTVIPASGTLRQQKAAFDQEVDNLSRVLELGTTRERGEEALHQLPDVPIPDWSQVDEVRTVQRALRAVVENRGLVEARNSLSSVLAQVGEDSLPIASRLRDSLKNRDIEGYRNALAQLETIEQAVQRAQDCDALALKLSSAPQLLQAIPPSESDEWRERASQFEEAWSWRYADTELDRLLDVGRMRELSLEVARLDREEKSSLESLSAELAWARMFAGLRAEQSQALGAWAVAVRKIGKGTGKYAEHHRRTARSYMGTARDAIPAWIMPTYRVAESLRAQPESFDVVIVDEASQSGVEALFLFYLAKQLVVVGDDQQIAPEAVGVNLSEVHRLQSQYLSGLPFGELFEPHSSLYDQANVRFAGKIVLREHFRCMPEIIEFSNRIAYRHRTLTPMRQYGSDRLDPIKSVFLPHGYREGDRQAINRPEAEEIVTRIEKIYSDPKYDDRSIGVVSLQGEPQARLIESMLLERLGPEQMLERSIVCGDAYAFQGDERDVMFLSMVAAPNRTPGPLSKESDKRRFNVAASRAADQVWLIHSIKSGELSNTDMRRALLEYYLDPKVEHLEELAEFDETVLNPVFDSQFEQDVYLEIRRRGFRVSPQVEAAGYRIDLVIEGGSARLAVECDGDEWHGAERWEEDSIRQRRLERAGWKFVRIRGSEFYRDPAAALEPVWRECERLQIEPGDLIKSATSTAEDPITGPEDVELDLADDESLQESPDSSEASGDGARATAEPLAVGQSEESTATGSPSPPESNPESQTELLEPRHTRVEVEHQRLGRGLVIRRYDAHDAQSPWLRIRFDDGSEFDYTRYEFIRAGFIVREGDLPGIETEVKDGDSDTGEPVGRHLAHSDDARVTKTSTGSHHRRAYVEWSGEGLPDPREAQRKRVAEYLFSIIRVEGPITTDRLYSVFIKGAGFDRVTTPARRSLNRALFSLRPNHITIDEIENPLTSWPQRVVRVSGAPPVVIRELGPRELYTVPLNEIAAVMRTHLDAQPGLRQESLKRKVLDFYDLVKLTEKADLYLNAAMRLLEEPGSEGGSNQ